MVAKEQAEAFAKAGHEVEVFSPLYSRADGLSSGKYRLTRLRPVLKYGNAAIVPQILWKIRGFDAVILHYPFFGAAEFFLFMRPKARLIIFYHMDVRGKGLLGRIFRWHQKYLMPLILGRAGKVIVTSLDYAYSGALRGLVAAQSDKFIEIPLGVDTERFAPRPRDAEFAARLKISSEEKVILFVGGLDSAHYFKGVPVLIDAFKKFSSTLHPLPYTLLIVGDGNLRPFYEKLAKELGIDSRTIFVGSASEADLPKYYNLADLFVLPSIDSSEAFGIVLLEAAASGLAAIATDLPGVRTVIKNNETGFLVPAGNISALARKFEEFFSKEADAEMGRAALERAREHYALPRIAQIWNKIIL